MTTWQPIETAPKDGTYILALVKGFIPSVARFDVTSWVTMEMEDFHCDDCWTEYHTNSQYHPTHWMPLPEPPKD